MAEHRTKRQWRVQGYDSSEPIFDMAVPLGLLSERQARELLARLAARHLTPEEILASSVRRTAKIKITHLDVAKLSPPNFGFMTNGNPHYTAITEVVPNA